MRNFVRMFGAVLAIVSFAVFGNLVAATYTDWGNGVGITVEIWCNDPLDAQIERESADPLMSECNNPEERVTIGDLGETLITTLFLLWVLHAGLWFGTNGWRSRDDKYEDDEEEI